MRSSTRLFLLALSVVIAGCDCAKKPAAPSLLKEGDACDNDERCETGLCDAAPGFSPICVRRCGDGCQPTEVCVQLTPNRFACQPDARKLCQPCAVDSDCPYPSDHCLSVNNEKVCGRDCAFDQNCPTGYRCVNSIGVDGLPKVQQCVPINASCACLARGDFQQACTTTNASGTCSGIKQCDLVSNSVVCDAREPSTETCNGVDDDCDGQIDEGQMATTCGVGACERSVSSCVDGGVAVCTPGDAGVERCNQIDDDCDGTVDDGFDTMADVMNCGACGNVCNLPNASSACTTGSCTVAMCNTGFENCNTMHPDGCEVNTRTDPMNCGGCGNACSRNNSTASCVNSMCQFVCAAGFIDLNQDPSDGCEYACTPTSTTDLPDLMFVDANCDGIDGELTNGVFVSPNGNDANPGTRAQPVLTLAEAMNKQTLTGKRDVYIAAGNYTNTLRILGAAGVNVAGAYHPTTWQRALSNQVTITSSNPGLEIDGSNNVVVQALRVEAANGDASKPTSYGGFIKESSGVKLESLELRAGNGLTGTPGTSQPAAAGGNVGTNGPEGCFNDPRWDPFNNPAEWFACNSGEVHCRWSSAPSGGAGGASSCGATGGTGGAPSRYNTPTTPNGQAGTQGQGTPAGGAAGQGVPPGVTPMVGSVYWGADGQPGGPGGNGSAASAGSFNANGYVLSVATAGSAGTAGRGGGGGGGGAGGMGAALPGYNGLQCYAYGSPGSGGGSGGCGGQGGTPGTSGGASIGLFLYNSQVTGQATLIRSGNGGNGGAGGSGGAGGTGAAGGTSDYDSKQGMATRGGGGGRGGNGGSGGHGGGGAGGSVYGIAKNSGSTWTPTGGSIMLGTPGTGGASSGNAGPAGASGVQTTF